MAIGTTAAIIGSAVVGAGASILGSKASKKAAGKAADAQAYAADRQFELGQQSLAFNRDIYNSNFGLLSPFVSRGNVAGNQINALLGLPNAPAIASPMAAPVGSPVSGGSQQQFDDAWAAQALSAVMPFVGPQRTAAVNGMSDPSQKLQYLIDYGLHNDEQTAYNAFLGGSPIKYAAPPPAPAAAPQTAADRRAARTAPSTANSAQSAFQQFANSAGMQFQQQEAANAINHNYAGAGALQSGAAMKAISDRAQQVALQNYFLPYMQLLGGQQGAGLQAGSAVAGVGTNAANTNANINGQMGANIGNTASNLGNIYMGQGANQANMWNNLGSSFGTILGAIK